MTLSAKIDCKIDDGIKIADELEVRWTSPPANTPGDLLKEARGQISLSFNHRGERLFVDLDARELQRAINHILGSVDD